MNPLAFGTVCLLSALVVFPSLPSALAQNTTVIVERQNAMKAVARASRTGREMVRGQAPFDAAKAAELFAAMKRSSATYGSLFPADSKTGEGTEAAPAIWEKPAEFQAAVAKFDADIAAAIAADPKDLDAFKASYAPIVKNCGDCHETFRIEK